MDDRRAIFISHATPEGNSFTLWLGAKLAAEGYEVWADVLRLNGGDDWQRKLEDALRHRALKVLLVADEVSVQKQGVRNEIQIASEVAHKLGDKNFVVPLRLRPFEAPFLVAHAQYIDFSKGWSTGLFELLELLETEYRVPKDPDATTAQWCSRLAVHGKQLTEAPEPLVSNWLAVRKLPEQLFYYRNSELRHHGIELTLPKVEYGDGFLSCEERSIQGLSKKSLEDALAGGWTELGISAIELRKKFTFLANQGIELLFRSRGLSAREMASGHRAWWFGTELPDSRLSFGWGDLKGSRVLRGYSDKRKVHWHYGVTASYRGGLNRHYRIKGRLLFSKDGYEFLQALAMQRMRKSFAKSWRNPRWRDMLLALLYWLSEGESVLRIPLHLSDDLLVEVPPLLYTSPVSIQDSDTAEVEADDPDIEFLDEEVLDDEEE